MKCRQCSNELFIDHIEKRNGGKIEAYVYVCLNPQCSERKKAFTAVGDNAECKINEQEIKP